METTSFCKIFKSFYPLFKKFKYSSETSIQQTSIIQHFYSTNFLETIIYVILLHFMKQFLSLFYEYSLKNDSQLHFPFDAVILSEIYE